MPVDDVTRSEVVHRSGGNCEARLKPVCTGRASHMHHRKLRRHHDDTPANLLYVCAACHTAIHNIGAPAYVLGLLVRSCGNPSLQRVHSGFDLRVDDRMQAARALAYGEYEGWLP